MRISGVEVVLVVSAVAPSGTIPGVWTAGGAVLGLRLLAFRPRDRAFSTSFLRWPNGMIPLRRKLLTSYSEVEWLRFSAYLNIYDWLNWTKYHTQRNATRWIIWLCQPWTIISMSNTIYTIRCMNIFPKLPTQCYVSLKFLSVLYKLGQTAAKTNVCRHIWTDW